MKKNIAVIGGSGFIGSNLTNILSGKNLHISIYDIIEPEIKYEGCTYEYLDIRDPKNKYEFLCDFEFVYILSALLGKGCTADPEDAWKTNVFGIGNLIKSLAWLPNKPRLIFTSSAMVYDTSINSLPLKESHPTEAKELYEISKIFGESIIHSCCKAFNAQGIVFRFFTVYGPGPASARKGHFIPLWIERAVKNEPLIIFDDGEQTIDLTHVSDVAKALAAAIDIEMKPGDFEVFNIASGIETRVKDIALWFQQVKPDIKLTYDSEKRGLPKRKFADIEKAQNRLHYVPEIYPKEGIINLLNEKLC